VIRRSLVGFSQTVCCFVDFFATELSEATVKDRSGLVVERAASSATARPEAFYFAVHR
jgi:hypothetical protein